MLKIILFTSCDFFSTVVWEGRDDLYEVTTDGGRELSFIFFKSYMCIRSVLSSKSISGWNAVKKKKQGNTLPRKKGLLQSFNLFPSGGSLLWGWYFLHAVCLVGFFFLSSCRVKERDNMKFRNVIDFLRVWIKLINLGTSSQKTYHVELERHQVVSKISFEFEPTVNN